MNEIILRDLEESYQGKPHRLVHVMGVVKTAQELGKVHGCDLEKLTTAALLHDITKYMSHEEHLRWIRSYYTNADEIIDDFNPNILHAFSAVAVASERYGIEDEDILNAIEHHTIGAPNMGLYEEIIFISDYIEPNRMYPSSIKVRPIAFESLNKAIYMAIDDSIIHHEQLQRHVPKQAYQARTFYQHKLEESK